jgi:lipoate-protein ligase A
MMGESWYLLEHGAGTPSWNMACDFWLLRHAREIGRPLLRTYGWDRPSVTIGYFQAWPSELASRYTIVRRPTGGALVYHDADLTFTVVLPPEHAWCRLKAIDRYRRVHERVAEMFARRGRRAVLAPVEPPVSRSTRAACFEKSSRYDVVLEGNKVAGGAQRVTRDGLLHQGSIQIRGSPAPTADELRLAWQESGVSFCPFTLTAAQCGEVKALADDVFGTAAWNEKGGFPEVMRGGQGKRV